MESNIDIIDRINKQSAHLKTHKYDKGMFRKDPLKNGQMVKYRAKTNHGQVPMVIGSADGYKVKELRLIDD